MGFVLVWDRHDFNFGSVTSFHRFDDTWFQILGIEVRTLVDWLWTLSFWPQAIWRGDYSWDCLSRSDSCYWRRDHLNLLTGMLLFSTVHTVYIGLVSAFGVSR